MRPATIILYSMAGLAFIGCFIDLIRLLLRRRNTKTVTGHVMQTRNLFPVGTGIVLPAAKRAIVEYTVDGRTYCSEKSIAIASATQIGAAIVLRYDKDDPEKLYTGSFRRIALLACMAVAFLVWAVASGG